jgi:DNA replication licensing factor MCM3
MDIETDQHLRECQREYLDFLDDENDNAVYHQKVRDMIADNRTRLEVNINDLRRKNPERTKKLLKNSFEEMIGFQRALKEFVSSIDPTYAKQFDEFYVGLIGSFGSKHVTPRSLVSSYLGNMVCLEGIVTRATLVRPKIVRSVHYCPATKKTMERRYTDLTSLDPYPSTGAYPTKDDDGNLLETEFGLSFYRDHQTFTVQEMPEKAPAGQLPRSVEIITDNDLVDACKPGDRVQVVGMYRVLPGKKNGYTTGTFRTVVIANNIEHINKEASPRFSAEDISKIKKFSRQKGVNVFEQLALSLAPSIHGHEYIKRAVLCMLLGGTEKILGNGTRIRGDINVLLIGDPSVAKSQMLRYVLNSAPRAIATTGRGSSGVGLTAAVTTDPDSGERRLEAGAMVLADRGIVCIDEFDKMSDIDRTAIHEVMEQGRVTIAKAGIHAKLNARCSVLAAANPVYGRYDQYKSPMDNIGLQDSLLSRFDLLFIVLDKNDPEHDREISEHVLRMHRYRNPGEQDGEALAWTSATDMLSTVDPDAEQHNDDEDDTPIFEKNDRLLHGHKDKKQRIISMKFMRKYIHVAREIKPVLTREAADYVAEEYSKLRNQDNLSQENIARTQPVTARSLETMIRLASAHAKCRMSKTVDVQDAQTAVELIQFAYFKKILQKEKKRKRADGDDEEDVAQQSEEEELNDKENDAEERPKRKRAARKERPPTDPNDPFAFDAESSDGERDSAVYKSARKSLEAVDQTVAAKTALTDARMGTFKKSLLNLFKMKRVQSLPTSMLLEFLNGENASEPFAEDEMYSAIQLMQDDNQIYLSDNILFLI